MIQEQYVSLKVAKLAKEKGFNEPCKEYYEWGNDYPSILPWGTNQEDLRDERGILAPTQAMLARWFREIHHINVEVICLADGYRWRIYQDGIATYSNAFNNYEGAKESGLQEALKRI